MMRHLIDSGFEWLGLIPTDWKSETIRHLLVARDGGAWGDEVPDGESGTICLRIADFDYGKRYIMYFLRSMAYSDVCQILCTYDPGAVR